MKKYSHILSFGCSFTEGGGLNTSTYHTYTTGDCKLSYDELEVYKTEHSYPSYLAQKLRCGYTNNGTSRSSNELIFKKLYEHTKNIYDGTGILVTIQTSILSRILLYLEDESRFETVNGIYGTGPIKDYYELYIKHFYNDMIEYQKLLQNVEVYSDYLKNKNFDFIWILGDTNAQPVAPTKNMLAFDGRNLLEFMSENRLTLRDLPNYPENDSHFTPMGNEIIATKILEHLEEYYGQ